MMHTQNTGWRDNILIAALLLCAFILIGRIVIVYISNPQNFPVRHVKIMAKELQLSHDKVEIMIQNAIDNHNFLTLHTQTLESTLMMLPWVQRVSVQKVWPDTVKITLIERKPVAAWHNELVSARGDLYRTDQSVKIDALPRLKSRREDIKEVLQVYQKMSKILLTYRLDITALEKRDNQAWELTLSNGVRLLLGKRDPETRLIRFCKAYPAVFEKKLDAVDRIDLRYPQGMAVAWKKRDPL